MGRHSFALISILLSSLLATTKCQPYDLEPQVSFESRPDSAQTRPPWSTLPVSNPTKSFWIDTPNANPLAREGSTGPLGFGDEDIDVCIIGSGITGVSAAYHLQRSFGVGATETGVERKIVILEAREFCSGATGRNGGHLTANYFNGFVQREQLYGKEDANKSYAVESYVVKSIVDIIQSEGWEDKVDLVHGGHVKVYNDEEYETARSDFEAAKASGLEVDGTEFLDRQTMLKTYGVNSSGLSTDGYNLWPLKFVSNLYNLSSTSNLNVKFKLHTLTPVTAVTPSDQDTKWVLATPRGSLSCNTVIHATNAYASYLLPQLQDRITPTRGQMFAVRAQSSLERLQRHSWVANYGNEYWFPRPEESGKLPLVLLGGGRDTAESGSEEYTTDDSVLNARVSETLKGFLPGLYAGTGIFKEGRDAEMQWTGIMGYTKSGAPIVGPAEGLEGQYMAVGFTGHGMPRTFAAAEAVAGMVAAKLAGSEWEAPDWLPEHYLSTWKH
ncbi:hypothetical protein NP233_g10911 [Leucocoprinus birnbaumii]|uniref:FAD dependent oxidoreductase domain-containing protein n=1 Tax=Leucocoprinus birnbaumii TaxID=56174 RepID=A0AAD5VHL2_9AGAR|nr:hypothetical protein NP233_g10911 [Leucocoprinus birnbaumii]